MPLTLLERIQLGEERAPRSCSTVNGINGWSKDLKQRAERERRYQEQLKSPSYQ